MAAILYTLFDIWIPLQTLLLAASIALLRRGAAGGLRVARAARSLCLALWAIGIYWFIGMPWGEPWIMAYEAVAWLLLALFCGALWRAARPPAPPPIPPPFPWPSQSRTWRLRTRTHTPRRD